MSSGLPTVKLRALEPEDLEILYTIENTVVSPNPENSEAMTLGMKLGTKLNADLVVATDPDDDQGIALFSNFTS